MRIVDVWRFVEAVLAEGSQRINLKRRRTRYGETACARCLRLEALEVKRPLSAAIG
jgi:hypothetical protein